MGHKKQKEEEALSCLSCTYGFLFQNLKLFVGRYGYMKHDVETKQINLPLWVPGKQHSRYIFSVQEPEH